MNDLKISIVVVIYNMSREAPRTLYSLSPQFQHEVSGSDYEVVVVDNGSTRPLSQDSVRRFGSNYRYIVIDDASPSPAKAINLAVSVARSDYVGIMIDGARIASPGIVRKVLDCSRCFEHPVLQTIGMHLGPNIQTESILEGYNQSLEDGLLTGINWRDNGYRLFEISSLAGSSRDGFFMPLNESNLIFLGKKHYYEIGGFNEDFIIPGGGFANLDFYNRATLDKSIKIITLLGEATFHQIHGGAITNQPSTKTSEILRVYHHEYANIYGERFLPKLPVPSFYGTIPNSLHNLLSFSAERYSMYCKNRQS